MPAELNDPFDDFTRIGRSLARMAASVLVALCMAACATAFPMAKGHALTFAPSDIALRPGSVEYESTLQLHWFGSSCYLIQLGETAILVDPYFTYQDVGHVLFSALQGDATLVKNSLAGLPRPQAIFATHSHYDHLLDAAAVHRLPGCAKVPIFGSRTADNILSGYGKDIASACRESIADGAWHEAARCVRYQALPANHAPQFPGVSLYTGQVAVPRETPPSRAGDFKGGDTFAYLFEICDERARYRVYMTGAPTDAPRGLPKDYPGTVDVALLCVADWRLASDYPDACIRRLQPREIVASHFDDFLLLSGSKRAVTPFADLNRFVRHVQRITTYKGFRAVRVPDVESVVLVRKAAAQ
jgi:L-ascorbate metabolism protein UlaG (beta-lactamase superfamily)